MFRNVVEWYPNMELAKAAAKSEALRAVAEGAAEGTPGLPREAARAADRPGALGAQPMPRDAFRSGCALGVTRTTPQAHMGELWELWGDERSLVGREERVLLVAALLDRQQMIAPSLGAAQLLARAFERFASRWTRDGERLDAGALSEGEAAVLRLAGEYAAALADRGLVEADEAAYLLADRVAAGEVPRVDLTVGAGVELSFGFQRLRDALSGEVPANGADGGAPAGEGVAVRDADQADAAPFALPELAAGVEFGLLVSAGPTALFTLVRDEVRTCLERDMEGVLVCGPDSQVLYDRLAPELVARGAGCALRTKVGFADTFLGRACTAVARVLAGEAVQTAATDFAYNPLSGIDAGRAQALNTAMRADRLLAPDRVAARLAEESPAFGALAQVVAPEAASRAFGGAAGAADAPAAGALQSGPAAASRLSDPAAALGRLVRDALRLSVAQRSRELAAVEALRGLLDAARRVGADGKRVMEMAHGRKVSVNVLAGEQDAPRVEFASIERLRTLSPRSWDAVMLSDVSDASFGASESGTALDGMVCRLGWAEPPSAFDEQRRLFAAAEGAARRRFTCLVPRRTPEGDEAYPSFLLKELAAAMAASARTEAAGAEEVAEWDRLDEDVFGLPVPLARLARCCGEEDLVAGVGTSFASPSGEAVLASPVRGALGQVRLADFLQTAASDGAGRVPVLSPSAIETYLQCPYQWFIARRVGIDELDEGFTNRETGVFMHGVFARFYDRLAARGVYRVRREEWPMCEALLNEVFDEMVAEQPERAPGSSRLVPLVPSEHTEIDEMRREALESLRRHALLPDGYEVLAHERVIAPEDEIDYAGVRLRGRADRVDVNRSAGRFAVLDYKGSASKYAAGVGEDEIDELALPPHVQALIYAQALRRADGMAGLHCAAAVYLGYREKADKGSLAGSADPSFDAPELMKETSAVAMNFEAFLDAIEDMVAKRLEGLLHGEIPQSPATKDACTYCPVAYCERRRLS